MSIDEIVTKIRSIFPDVNLEERRNFRKLPKMSMYELKTRMRNIFPDVNLNKRRNSNCVDCGPPTKLPKNSDDPILSVRKSLFLRQMESILSQLESDPPICEPKERLEYSDGEDVIIVQRFQRSDLRLQHCRFDKMNAVNNETRASRPPPPLIHKSTWSRVQKMNAPRRGQRLNGYQYENDTAGCSNILSNGNSLSFKPRNSQHPENNAGRTSNMSAINSTVGYEFTSVNLHQKLRNESEERVHFEKMFKCALPDYGHGQPIAVPDSLPTSRRQSFVSNHFSSRSPLRTSGAHVLDDDFHKKQEDATRLFAETSSKSEINQLSSMRVMDCSSNEDLAPASQTPDVVVFDEDMEEKINDFPEFTDSQENTIQNALNAREEEVLISKYGISITGRKIRMLNPPEWLDDQVIDFYMGLLQERGEREDYPKVFAMSTVFTQNLFIRGYASVSQWTKNVDIFGFEIIPVPVHVNDNHWCMAIINLVEKTIKYYDSMGSPNDRVLDALENYLKQESLKKKKIEFDMSDWRKENVTDNPRQENGDDCGVFCCMTAEFICRNRPITFTQQHMKYFRRKMVLEICSGELLL